MEVDSSVRSFHVFNRHFETLSISCTAIPNFWIISSNRLVQDLGKMDRFLVTPFCMPMVEMVFTDDFMLFLPYHSSGIPFFVIQAFTSISLSRDIFLRREMFPQKMQRHLHLLGP